MVDFWFPIQDVLPYEVTLVERDWDNGTLKVYNPLDKKIPNWSNFGNEKFREVRLQTIKYQFGFEWEFRYFRQNQKYLDTVIYTLCSRAAKAMKLDEMKTSRDLMMTSPYHQKLYITTKEAPPQMRKPNDLVIGYLKVELMRKVFEFAGPTFDLDLVVVTDFFVFEQYRGIGYGRAMFNLMLHDCKIKPFQVSVCPFTGVMCGFLSQHYDLWKPFITEERIAIFHKVLTLKDEFQFKMPKLKYLEEDFLRQVKADNRRFTCVQYNTCVLQDPSSYRIAKDLYYYRKFSLPQYVEESPEDDSLDKVSLSQDKSQEKDSQDEDSLTSDKKFLQDEDSLPSDKKDLQDEDSLPSDKKDSQDEDSHPEEMILFKFQEQKKSGKKDSQDEDALPDEMILFKFQEKKSPDGDSDASGKVSSPDMKDASSSDKQVSLDSKDTHLSGKVSSPEMDTLSSGKISADVKDTHSSSKVSPDTKDANSSGRVSSPDTKDTCSSSKVSPDTKDANSSGRVSSPDTKDTRSSDKVSSTDTKDTSSSGKVSPDMEDTHSSGKVSSPDNKDTSSDKISPDRKDTHSSDEEDTFAPNRKFEEI